MILKCIQCSKILAITSLSTSLITFINLDKTSYMFQYFPLIHYRFISVLLLLKLPSNHFPVLCRIPFPLTIHYL